MENEQTLLSLDGSVVRRSLEGLEAADRGACTRDEPSEVERGSEYLSVRIKEESDARALTECTRSVRVKEEPGDDNATDVANGTRIECACPIKEEEDGNVDNVGAYAPTERARSRYKAVCVKEEPGGHEGATDAADCAKGGGIRIECVYSIKEEDDGSLGDVGAYAPAERTRSGYTSVRVKEEPGEDEDARIECASAIKGEQHALREDACAPAGHTPSARSSDFKEEPVFCNRGFEDAHVAGLVVGDKSDVPQRPAANKEKKLACPVCGKAFAFGADLRIHERIHTGQKPFSCPECGKCFSRQWCLLTHQQTHAAEKPFSCSECGKCYSQNSQLVRHRKIHTGESLYPCDVCGRTLTRRSTLLGHLRMHRGEKPFSCEECGKSFTRKTTLAKHKFTHQREKSYICAECGNSFVRFGQLVKHQQAHAGQ